MQPKERVQNIIEIRREADSNRHVGDSVFEYQVPADDPGDNLAESRVRVSICAARDRNHRGKLSEAQAREAARDRDEYERKRDAPDPHPGVRQCDRMPEVQQYIEHRRVEDSRNGQRFARCRRSGQNEDSGPDHSTDAEGGQTPRPQRFRETISGCSDSAISLSMLRVRKRLTACAGPGPSA